MFKLLLLISLASLAECLNEVRHVELNGASLIDSSPNNYAITAQSLQMNHWATVSVNGNNYVAISPECQVVTKTPMTLTNEERNAIEMVRNQLANADNGAIMNGQTKFSSVRFSLGSGVSQSVRSFHTNLSTFQSNGLSIIKADDNNFSVAKASLPNNISRIFVINNIVAFVYAGGEIQMKPINCLTPTEAQLVQQIRNEVLVAEQQFKQSMEKFHQNMNNMQQNLHQNMQQMQYNLQNMFSNNFPFGNAQVQQPNHYQYNPNLNQGYGYNMNSNVMSSNIQPVFGNQFPFGPVNSPFGNGFPFNG